MCRLERSRKRIISGLHHPFSIRLSVYIYLKLFHLTRMGLTKTIKNAHPRYSDAVLKTGRSKPSKLISDVVLPLIRRHPRASTRLPEAVQPPPRCHNCWLPKHILFGSSISGHQNRYLENGDQRAGDQRAPRDIAVVDKKQMVISDLIPTISYYIHC